MIDYIEDYYKYITFKLLKVMANLLSNNAYIIFFDKI